jgi:excisionase family DNA binding protein
MVDPFEHKAFYSPSEVATILGVSHSYVTDSIRVGRIAAVHVSPRVTRIPYATLMALLANPLPIRRRRMTPAEIKAVSQSLVEEDVAAPVRRYSPR